MCRATGPRPAQGSGWPSRSGNRRQTMLSSEDNDLLCRVGRGTPMGELLRHYWMPCLPSTELPVPDGPPKKVRLLGENLVAFRDTRGEVGLLPANRPHRGASLFFGRNEECGLRCSYHGWKFDVTGRCVDMPNEPEESTFKDKVRARAYPCRDVNGVLWTYMGPRATAPALRGAADGLRRVLLGSAAVGRRRPLLAPDHAVHPAVLLDDRRQRSQSRLGARVGAAGRQLQPPDHDAWTARPTGDGPG